jgi:pilus assembly protein CpaB
MRRGRIFIFLALIIILGLVGAFFVQQRFFSTPEPDTSVEGQPAPVPVVEMAEIIIAVQNIPRGTLIIEEHLGTMELPRENVLETMFLVDQMEAVVGRQARHDIDSGTPLTAGMLIDLDESFSDTGSIASLSIPKGMVAIPVPVDRLSSVAYALRPGDHVSVIASFLVIDVDTEFQSRLPNTTGTVISTGSPGEGQPALLTINISQDQGTSIGRTELDPLLNELVYVTPSESQRARLVTQILMQDAIVLRYGEFPWDDLRPQEPEPAAGEEGEAPEAAPEDAPETPEEQPPDVVTLIVTPQEAVALEHLMKSQVSFKLVLRASGDTDPIDTEGVTFQYLLETYNIPVPAKLPYGLEPRFDELPTPEPEE